MRCRSRESCTYAAQARRSRAERRRGQQAARPQVGAASRSSRGPVLRARPGHTGRSSDPTRAGGSITKHKATAHYLSAGGHLPALAGCLISRFGACPATANPSAFVVGHAIGLDVTDAARDYIQLYRGDALAESLGRIQRTATVILTAISGEKPSDRGAFRAAA